MKRNQLILAAASTLVFALGNAQAQDAAKPAAAKPPTNDWLLEAPDDTERFRRLQQYLRGFDQPMWEVGDRWAGLHEALKRDNFDLAIYHWDKIKTTIENGYLKRPARRANSDAVLFNSGVFAQVRTAFESRNRAKAWEGFAAARAACMTCHEAEKVAYMNNQPLLDLAGPAK